VADTDKQTTTYCIKVNEDQLNIENDVVSLCENSSEGIVVGDLWGYISDVNQTIVKMFGAKHKSEFIGKHVLEFLVKEERSRATQESLNAISNNQDVSQKCQIHTKNGQKMTILVITKILKNRQGDQIGFIDIVKQLTN
jgi:PAS domain S-box-containing protein